MSSDTETTTWRRATLLAAVVGLVLLGAAWAVREPNTADDRAAIEETVRHYFRGDVERDVERLKKAFHPHAELLTAGEEGELEILTQEAWHESVEATPDRERPEPELLSVDIHGKAALAKTRLTFSDGRFTDYLSLLKLDGGWVIVNKIYHWEDF